MRIVLLLLAVALLAAAAPPEKGKKPSGKSATSGTKANDTPPAAEKGKATKTKDVEKDAKANNTNDNLKGNNTEFNNTNAEGEFHGNGTTNLGEESVARDDYCYDSTWSFRCRQTNPLEHALECRIANDDGNPCFPDVVKMIEAAAPLTTITYPIHSYASREAAEEIDNCTTTIITADNIESISLHAPFEAIPADAFAGLPKLKRIVLEELDGVKTIIINKNAFRNTTAKHLQLDGYDIYHIMAQKVDLHYFDTITFSDMKIDCHRNWKYDEKLPGVNVSCEHLFDDMKSLDRMNLETVYVGGDVLDERIFKPMWDSLKKLNLDVIFTDKIEKDDQYFLNNTEKTNYTTTEVRRRAHFPVETFAFMTKLEEMELFLYGRVAGLSIENDTAVPLPVSKTLTRMTLSCRYCDNIELKHLGKMLPNLRHLTIAAPMKVHEITELCLKSFTKLEELIIYDSALTAIKPGAFRSTEALKRLIIKYAGINELKQEHLDGLKDTLEILEIVGTQIKHINVSKFEHLDVLDVSQNRLTKIERSMLPEKAKFADLNLSYNPIEHVEHGFLKGIELKNKGIHIRGWDIESFDINVMEGVEKLHTLDITNNLKLKKVEVSDHKDLPTDLKRIVVGRSPYLKLENHNDTISTMLRERNMTMVVEGKVACCCGMAWMIKMEKEYPDLIEIDSSRAVCSREGTVVDKKLPEDFWKKPTVANFLKAMENEKVDMCKKDKAMNEK